MKWMRYITWEFYLFTYSISTINYLKTFLKYLHSFFSLDSEQNKMRTVYIYIYIYMECFRIEHQRFKEGRESVSDDERCGTSKEVRTTELIGQIKNFMDKDRRVSTETIRALFNVCVGTVHTISREVCPKGALRRSERKTLSWQQEDGQFRSWCSWCSGELRWKLDLLLWPRHQETEFPLEASWLSLTQKDQKEQIHP